MSPFGAHQKSAPFTVTISALSICVFCGALANTGDQESRLGPPGWSLRQWTDWRDRGIARIFEPTFESGADKILSREDVFTRCAEEFALIEPYLRSRPGLINSDPERRKELSNYVSFLNAQHWLAIKSPPGQSSHNLGFRVSDQEYWNQTVASVQLPDLLQSQNFLDKMSHPSGYRDAVRMIEEQNANLPGERKWIVLPFLAQFIKSVDRTTYGRLLVVVPNEPLSDGRLVDKWVNFAIATPDLNQIPEELSVSIVAIERKPATVPNAATGTSNAYFMDFLRLRDRASGTFSLVPTVMVPSHPSKNCYDCHKTAAVPIYPEIEYAFDKAGALAPKTGGVGEIPKRINARIRGYGLADFGFLDVKSYGPSIGPPERERTDEFIREASERSDLSAESIGRVRSAMMCAKCHRDFAPINYIEAATTDRDQKAFKNKKSVAQTFVEHGVMPPGNTLTSDERKALWKCLTKEYLDPPKRSGVLIEWLKGRN